MPCIETCIGPHSHHLYQVMLRQRFYICIYLVVGDVEVSSSLRIDVLEPEDMAPALELFLYYAEFLKS